MNRNNLIEHIAKRYNVTPDSPWQKWPNYLVFRHSDNNKWFGILMDVPAFRLGLEGENKIDVLNVKVDPNDAVVLKMSDFILPAYHMNKENWVSLVIEGEIPDDMLDDLIEQSFHLTH